MTKEIDENKNPKKQEQQNKKLLRLMSGSDKPGMVKKL